MSLRRFAAALAVLLLCSAGTLAGDGSRILDAWVREAPPGTPVLAAYLTLDNPSSGSLVLLGVRSPEFGRVEIHETVFDQGMARMRQLQALTLAPGEQLALEPGAHHLMLFDPVHPLRAGDSVALEFEWSDGERSTVQAPVRRGDGGGEHDHHHHHHHH